MIATEKRDAPGTSVASRTPGGQEWSAVAYGCQRGQSFELFDDKHCVDRPGQEKCSRGDCSALEQLPLCRMQTE